MGHEQEYEVDIEHIDVKRLGEIAGDITTSTDWDVKNVSIDGDELSAHFVYTTRFWRDSKMEEEAGHATFTGTVTARLEPEFIEDGGGVGTGARLLLFNAVVHQIMAAALETARLTRMPTPIPMPILMLPQAEAEMLPPLRDDFIGYG